MGPGSRKQRRPPHIIARCNDLVKTDCYTWTAAEKFMTTIMLCEPDEFLATLHVINDPSCPKPRRPSAAVLAWESFQWLQLHLPRLLALVPDRPWTDAERQSIRDARALVEERLQGPTKGAAERARLALWSGVFA